ncbi:hypothetical protein Val02_13980 [Virgisporangium aliadipatigenens]|uniref:DUF2637 domain-containing protein n=1 Tax=Virgisporangium aliadipatigenens TaxID=741659 RepID=A0A8J3YHR2_9ACTN|nr:DUF2637 domain-containing protein [Virgisporangium aliadipatigenens]GIJ44512.1 hypothetical protein Val02_13980 [Virgisporangium aliadipatigenens]
MSTPKPADGERFEGVVQVLIMLAIGGMAGAASFTHVHDVAVAHGQPNWIGWADAVVVELMSIALGLELRRRARTNRPTGFVISALVFFVLVSLAAQVVEAEPSVIGWLAAALPAIGFVVLAKVVLSRTAAISHTIAELAPTTPPAPTPVTATPGDVSGQFADAAPPAPAEPPASVPTNPAGLNTVPVHMLAPARFAAVNHQQSTGRPITTDELAARLSIPPAIAGQLLTAITDDGPATQPEPVRVNGTPVLGGVA